MNTTSGIEKGMAIPRDISGQEAEAAQQRDTQNQINEGTFSSLQAQCDEARRVGDFLEQALQAARLREQVLGGAMDRLNDTQPTAPLRS